MSELADKVDLHTHDMNAATGLFIGAGVLAVGAVATWFLWPAPQSTAPAVTAWCMPTAGGAAAGVGGSF